MLNDPTVIPGYLPKHGSPPDRGSADRYYGRDFDPHWWPLGTSKGIRVEMADMSSEEIVQYSNAYRDETDRKDWG